MNSETEFLNHNWKFYDGNQECPVEEEPAEQDEPVEEEERAECLHCELHHP